MCDSNELYIRQEREGGDCLKTKEFTIRNRHSKISIWDT